VIASAAAHPAGPLQDLPKLALVLGGARSGKSRYAEQLIGVRPALYIATSEPHDDEMRARIRDHQARRDVNWTTRDVPLALAAALREADRPVLVECLTLWLANLLGAGLDPEIEMHALIAALSATAVPVILVSNEVGLGIVPDNKLAREFCDHAGRLHQALAAVATRVIFVAAGLPLTLKDTP
jgi:adenosylcobinamide kinase / adenosylcobinamide-phosphate guanylyltransferase